MSEDNSKEVRRWTAKRRTALVVSILKGETSAVEAARRHGLKVSEVEDWQEKFMLAAENALRSRPREEEALKDEQIQRLKQKVGELTGFFDSATNFKGPRHPGNEGGLLSDRRLGIPVPIHGPPLAAKWQ